MCLEKLAGEGCPMTGQKTDTGTGMTATCSEGLTRQSISVSSPPEVTG